MRKIDTYIDALVAVITADEYDACDIAKAVEENRSTLKDLRDDLQDFVDGYGDVLKDNRDA